ncbi:UNVERIFIED_CONTAM: hypothetical protein K2H54_041249 [Gekko kuhli]
MAGAGAGTSPREKRSTAARLKAALSSSNGGGGGSGAEESEANAELQALLERVLCPAPGGGEAVSEALAWCRCLLAGGEPWDGFVQAVRAYDPATLCGLVWTANFVAYRCRTCGISPCMSLCAECFHQGEHAGHDYNMFRSQAGGACDCGDGNVMREAGTAPATKEFEVTWEELMILLLPTSVLPHVQGLALVASMLVVLPVCY